MTLYDESNQTSKAELAKGPFPKRACVECKRKKAKCDMQRPACSLCFRIGEVCIYPTSRAQRRKRNGLHGGSKVEVFAHCPRERSSTILSSSLTGGAQPWNECIEVETETITTTAPEHVQSSGLTHLPETESTFNWSIEPVLEPASPHFEFLQDLDGMGHFPQWQNLDFNLSSSLAGNVESDRARVGSTESLLIEHETTLPSAEEQGDYSGAHCLKLAPTIAKELIDLFFDKVQCFLPLFHRELFAANYGYISHLLGEEIYFLSFEDVFILNSMFSLSARFSISPFFKDMEPIHRGDCFLAEATRLYEWSSQDSRDQPASLAYLQGLILLTFSTLQLGPSRKEWLLTGACARLAYELNLHNTDVDIISGVTDPLQACVGEWQERESRRRAWWIVWDMDTFASTMALRPFALDGRRMDVLLPVSDKHWLGPDRLRSAPLSYGLNTAWKSLCDSSNQDEWAWFLVCTSVLRHVLEAISCPSAQVNTMKDVEAEIACFALALPEHFQMDAESLLFDDTHYVTSNWILCTAMVLQCSRSFLILYKDDLNSLREAFGRGFRIEKTSYFKIIQTIGRKPRQDLLSSRSEITRAVRLWSPQYLARSNPLVAGSLVGPAFVHVLCGTSQDGHESQAQSLEIVTLALKRLARRWMIGQFFVETLELLKNAAESKSSNAGILDMSSCKHWASMLPW